MRIDSAREIGLVVRERRRELAMTQSELSSAAGVSRRWLSDLEGGKSTAEIGLVFRVLHALHLAVDASPSDDEPGPIDLDDLLRAHTGPGLAETESG